MAVRFVNYSTRMNDTVALHPTSSEPNTPWMLADVVMQTAQEQARAGSVRKVQGDAQVDFLLCSDPKCQVLVDVVKIKALGAKEQPDRRFLAISGIAASSFQTGIATATTTVGSEGVSHPDWLPPDAQQPGSIKMTINEVIWLVNDPSVVKLDEELPSCTRTRVLPFVDQALTSNFTWQSLAFGHYRVTDSFRVMPLTKTGGCMTIIWPNHRWMVEHGWGVSDPACEREFQRLLVGGCVAGESFYKDPVVAVFDSMFTQAQVARRCQLNSSLVRHEANGDVLYTTQRSVTPVTANFLEDAFAIMLSDKKCFQGAPNLTSQGVGIKAMHAYLQYAGRLGVTLA